MKIELKKITVRDLVEDYDDDGEGGVRGFGGKLDIRPPFQREFVYKAKQRDAVVETINKGFPLNVMYWALRDDGTYEVWSHMRTPIARPPATNRPIAFPRVSRRSGLWSHKPFVIAPRPSPRPDPMAQRSSVALPSTVAGRTRRWTLAGAGCASRPSPSATAGWLRPGPILRSA